MGATISIATLGTEVDLEGGGLEEGESQLSSVTNAIKSKFGTAFVVIGAVACSNNYRG